MRTSHRIAAAAARKHMTHVWDVAKQLAELHIPEIPAWPQGLVVKPYVAVSYLCGDLMCRLSSLSSICSDMEDYRLIIEQSQTFKESMLCVFTGETAPANTRQLNAARIWYEATVAVAQQLINTIFHVYELIANISLQYSLPLELRVVAKAVYQSLKGIVGQRLSYGDMHDHIVDCIDSVSEFMQEVATYYGCPIDIGARIYELYVQDDQQ